MEQNSKKLKTIGFEVNKR